ncbi:MAG: SSU ribosomal protein S4p (S9e) @ SSU ribosomal protein S4p (S9e), zinc-dependent, partial [uncultured Gemmatimonadetes bacterium]
GSLHRAFVPALPPRRTEAVPQGHQVLHREVPGGAPPVRPRPARPVGRRAPQEGLRVRAPASREAEGEAHLRRGREAVPQPVREGRPRQGRHGREPPRGAGEPAGQHPLPDGLRVHPQGGPPAHHPRARAGERPQAGHRLRPGAPGRRGAHRAQEQGHPAGAGFARLQDQAEHGELAGGGRGLAHRAHGVAPHPRGDPARGAGAA